MISTQVHAVPHGLSTAGLAVGPTLTGWPRALPPPLLAAGVAAYSLATRYNVQACGTPSLDQHRGIDMAQGLAFLAAGASVRTPREFRLALAGYGAFSFAPAALTRPPNADRIDRQIPLPSSATISPDGADLAQSVASEGPVCGWQPRMSRCWDFKAAGETRVGSGGRRTAWHRNAHRTCGRRTRWGGGATRCHRVDA